MYLITDFVKRSLLKRELINFVEKNETKITDIINNRAFFNSELFWVVLNLFFIKPHPMKV